MMNTGIKMLPMKVLGAAGLLALAACGGGADDKAAENIEAIAENQADGLDAQAEATTNDTAEDMLEGQADNVREMGEETAEQADDNDDATLENRAANTM